MIALMDNGQDLDECAAEIGCEVGQLLTPLTRYTLRDPDRPWAIDNGFFSPSASIDAWLSLLEREKHHQKKCLFITLPDVVGSARRTLEVFEHWRRQECLRGWKRALVCQDGQEDLPMPWDDISAIFLGGSTNWKCGPHAVHLVKAAQALGKWVHAGRVKGGRGQVRAATEGRIPRHRGWCGVMREHPTMVIASKLAMFFGTAWLIGFMSWLYYGWVQ